MTAIEMTMLYYLMGIIYMLAKLRSPAGKVWVEVGLGIARGNDENLRRWRIEKPKLYEAMVQLALALLAFVWPKMMLDDVIGSMRGR